MIEPLSLITGTAADGAAYGSPAAGYPIERDVIKTHCAVDGTAMDSVLDIYLPAAIDFIEGSTHRTLMPRQHQWILKRFPPGCEAIRLPRGKTISVASIAYITNGETVTLAGPSSAVPGEGYQEDLRHPDGGWLMPARGGSWPCADTDHPAPVVITFVAGYEALPSDLVNAILFSISSRVEIRGASDVGMGIGLTMKAELAESIELFISPYRLSRIY